MKHHEQTKSMIITTSLSSNLDFVKVQRKAHTTELFWIRTVCSLVCTQFEDKKKEKRKTMIAETFSPFQ